MFYPRRAARARAEPGADAAARPRARRPSAPCPRRSSRRTRATSIPGRSPPASTRCSRPARERDHARRAARADASRRGARPRAARRGGIRDAARHRRDRPPPRSRPCAALPQVVVSARRARARAFAGSARAVPADGARATSRSCRSRSATRSAQEVAEVLDALWGGPETLIVVSSDLSHYLPYADAQAVDRATAKAILGARHRHLARAGVRRDAGHRPHPRRAPARAEARADRSAQLRRHRRRQEPRRRLRLVRLLRRRRRHEPVVLTSDRATSCSQTAAAPLPRDAGPVLLPLARAAIAASSGIAPRRAATTCPGCKQQAPASSPSCASGKLRGCIGTLRAHRALGEDVQGQRGRRRVPRSTLQAARRRRSSTPISLEVSVLSALEPLALRRRARRPAPAARRHRRRRLRVRPPLQHLPAAGLGRLHGARRTSSRISSTRPACRRISGTAR